MELSNLIPIPDAIPVHWGWLEGLLLLTFAVHLLFMNAMLGSGLIAVFNHFIKPSEEKLSLNRDLSEKLPFIIAFAINMGVPPLLFLSVLYGHLAYVSTVLMAIWWMSIVALLIIGYYGAYAYRYKFDILGKYKGLLLAAVCLILLYVGFIISNNASMMLRPEKWTEYFANPSGTILNLDDITIWPRYLHFVTASLAVGGLFIALIWHLKERKGAKDCAAKINLGMRWFIAATAIQVGIGVWFLLVQPAPVRDLFLGQSIPYTLVLLTAIVTTALMLVLAVKRKVIPTVAFLVVTVIVMTICRELLRLARLEGIFSPSDLTVNPQYSPMVLFIISLIIGIIAVVYMLKLASVAMNKGGK